MWKVGGIKIESAAGRQKKMRVAMEFREKWKFFVNRSVPENFQWENFSRQVPRNPYALRIQNIYMKGGYKIFLTVFSLPEVGRCR